MLNPCARSICIFFPEKNIIVADGLIWTDGGNKNAIELGQEGSSKAEEVQLKSISMRLIIKVSIAVKEDRPWSPLNRN